jgi:hypothetical protein
MVLDFVVFRNESRSGSGRMSQRTDTRVPLMEGTVGTTASLSTSEGTDPAFAISDEDSHLLRSLLQALSQEVGLEDPQFLSALTQIGRLARSLGDRRSLLSAQPTLT